jgi:hypothetical protein
MEEKIKAEFQQIKSIIQESLVGETIYTLGRECPNRILKTDDLGISVHARSDSLL